MVSVDSKVAGVHLRRAAYVYVRQSTLLQVREHTESLQRQYELVERAAMLGWPASRIVTIDEDLGRSGADATARSGFQRLVADVGLGQVGLILGIEVSRLARNNADWYQLLDLCALTDTLIADVDGIYHPRDFNDRLVLGLKGTMSEAELHLIRGRLTAGLRHKAARGELRQGLPVGFDYDDDGRVVLCADESVVAAISEVFARFDQAGSARQVLLGLLADGLLLPRRPARRGMIRWAPATYAAVHDVLTNPCYAGAFVFGRTRTDKRLDADGRLVVATRQVAVEEWEVCIPDHHPGFISWERWHAIQARLRANWRAPRGHGGGPAREGAALLQGLIRCGVCGRIMQTGYSGTKGNCPRYLCARAQQLYGAASCQSIGGRRLEQQVLEQVFAVLEPVAIEATIQALGHAHDDHQRRLGAFELAAERARYHAERAQRQFDAVEPENRLVARTVEAAWEQRLADQRQAEADLARQRARKPAMLSEEETAWLRRAGADLRATFNADTTTVRDRKQLLRAIIGEVVLTIDRTARTAHVRIIWQGGATTEFTMTLTKTGGHFRTTEEDTVDLVRRLAADYDDTTIALILSRQRRTTATGLSFTKSRVKSLRVSRGIPAYTPPEVTPQDEDDVVIATVQQSEQLLGISKATIYRWLRDGLITGEQLTAGAPWRIRIDQTVRDRITPTVPDGWITLDEAATALGVARQTVLHKVQRGELQAVHVNRGGRKGLRIQVNPTQPGLFDQPR